MEFIEVSEATDDIEELFNAGKLYMQFKGFTEHATKRQHETFSFFPTSPIKVQRVDFKWWWGFNGYYNECYPVPISLVTDGRFVTLQLLATADAQKII